MDVTASLDAVCDAGLLFSYVDDLGRYGEWMDLVHRAQLAADASATWDVELRARVGPLARSKRLRMRRTHHDESARVVVFERSEADGRSHSEWALRAEVNHDAGRSTLVMHLHYGGGLWTGGVLEKVLSDAIRRGQQRLAVLVTG